MTQSLRKICDEATAGPWHLAEHNWQETSVYSVNGTVCKLSLSEDDVTEDNQDEKEAEQLKTAKFIAIARTALPAALDLIEKLRGKLDAMAAQKREPEMTEEELENADFEFAYDCLVRVAREALAAVKEFEK